MTGFILTSPIWKDIAPYIRIEVYDRDGGHSRPRFRIEFDAMPDNIARRATAFQMPCVACGNEIHPIRARRPPGNKRGGSQHLYYAPSCPLHENVGCSRGQAARDDYQAIKAFADSQPRV